MISPSERGRLLASAALAAALHLLFAVATDELSLREKVEAAPERLDLTLFTPPPPAPPEPAPEPEPAEPEDTPPVAQEPEPSPPKPPPPEPPPPEPPPEPVLDDVAPPPPAPAPAPPPPAAAPPPIPEPVERPPELKQSPRAPLVRKRPRGGPSLLGRVMDARGKDPFGSSLQDVEKHLEYKADGPMSDAQRAAKTAKRWIEDDLSEDAVNAGLADDYFRELKNRIETAWMPAMRDLNDGGESVTRYGFLKGFGVNRAAWGEVLSMYLDVAEQYGKGEKLYVERKKLERARELFRSKKGNFRVHAIAEVVVTQASGGEVLTIEFPIDTGHPGLDDSIRDAILKAVAVMPYEPPPRLSNGRAFRSKWRMRATWRMIPPTALMRGNAWDITPQGVEVDVPFQIKLQTNILLMSFDNRSHSLDAR